MLKNIPKEMRVLNQWVIATKNVIKSKDKLPINANTGRMADPTNAADWADFDDAVAARSENNPHLGFVLSQDDPYSIIDLDDPYDKDKAWDDETREQHAALNAKIMKAFESYTELSQSGNGVHIIVKGSIPKGVNRDTVELYSSQRYMITTGDVLKDIPIVDCQDLLDILFYEMAPRDNKVALVDVDQSEDDAIVIDKAMAAANGKKFIDLCNSVPDGIRNSEQDMALLSIICFYTKCNEQARRIFRKTGRGQRDKVNKNDKYLNFTLQVIRANEVPDIDFTAIKKQLSVMQEKTDEVQAPVATGTVNFSGLIAKAKSVAKGEPISKAKVTVKRKKDSGTSFAFPDGLIGDLAEYFYASAARPVREMGLMGSIGFFAGLVGRQYNVSGVGLNQYLIILARTGTGKEGIAGGISRIVNVLRNDIPMIVDIMGPSAFASGPALVKTMADKPCFLSILGEFGLTLQQLCDPKANSAQVTLRQAYLDLYMKSGKDSVLNSSVYSDKDKNTEIVQSPALSILGESTPETFYEGLSEHHISDGLIPRFTIYEYKGDRPYLNEDHSKPPSKKLVRDLVCLIQAVMDMKMNQSHVDVAMTEEVIEVAREFERDTTDLINTSDSLILRQLWSRADLKIKKLAALLAVGNNFQHPKITMVEYNWARKFVETDINAIMMRFTSGDIGYGEDKQRTDVVRIITNYFSKKTVAKMYKTYHVNGVFPIAMLRRSVPQLNSFKKDTRGIGMALRTVLQDCVEAGELIEVPASQAKTTFNTAAKLYAIGDSWSNE